MAQSQRRQFVNSVGFFCHSSHEYNLKEFVDVFQRKLPVVFVVTQGFYGIDDMHSIASEEIYRIERIVQQPRVVLRQRNGTMLSIPEEYKYSKFQYLTPDGRASKPMSLKQMINEKKRQLQSLKIQLQNDSEAGFTIGNEKKSSTSLGILEFIDTYREKYLIGFSVIQGNLATTALAIPVYVDINGSIVTNMAQKSPTHLDHYLRQLPAKMVQACNKAKLNEDISMLPKGYKSESDYEYIIPDHYMTLVQRQNDVTSSRKSVTSPLTPAYLSQNVPPTQPGQLYSRHPVTETRPQSHGNGLPIRSSLSLPLPSPPSSVYRDNHPYTRMQSTPDTVPTDTAPNENPYGSRPIYNSFSEVPRNLSGLSKYRIADCLRLLNLQHHGNRFIKESMDGNLVTALNDKMLVQEFNFRQFEAIKFMKFVRGWRPVEEEFV